MIRTMAGTVLAMLLLAGPQVAAASDVKVSPRTVEGATTISVEEAKALFEKEVMFVDVRSDTDFEAGRIPGAVHLELKKVFSENALLEVAGKDEELVLYCNGPKCMRSSKASALAVGWGFRQVHYFRDGFPAWKSEGHPVE